MEAVLRKAPVVPSDDAIENVVNTSTKPRIGVVSDLTGINRFNNSIRRLVEISPTFQGIPVDFLRSAILKEEITRRQYGKGETIIQEGDSRCDHFFALLSGSLLVSKDEEPLTSIDKVCSFGTIGYFVGKRSADVIAATSSTVLILKRQTIQHWPQYIQTRLYENLSRELSKIIEGTNKIMASDTRCTDKVQNIKEKLLNLGI